MAPYWVVTKISHQGRSTGKIEHISQNRPVESILLCVLFTTHYQTMFLPFKGHNAPTAWIMVTPHLHNPGLALRGLGCIHIRKALHHGFAMVWISGTPWHPI